MISKKTVFNDHPHMKNTKDLLKQALKEIAKEKDFNTQYEKEFIENCITSIDDNVESYLERCYQEGEKVSFK